MVGKGLSQRRNERFNPWFSFQDEMKNLLDRFNEDWSDLGTSEIASGQFIPKVDILEQNNSLVVTAEIPGMDEKDINVSFDQNVLTLEGEKKSGIEKKGKGYLRSEIQYGHFYRTIPLEVEIDEEKIQASYKDGMLKIILEKKGESMKKQKKIDINPQKQIQ
jgi:HSP20 family protein